MTAAIGTAQAAFEEWRTVPAPVRGHLVRELGERCASTRRCSASLVSIEAGKIRSEGLGEVRGDDRHLRVRGGPLPPACTA
ncbi:aldehyde dehydrogenase family protein [Nocardioides convexus]|uniref:aldehyde dehydrogenase family protein n=1 Tax=Nocardioides convexus TaxID=2712224 RepID=UPI00241887B5|nr:aldehyde dehydrogenase family protein [Nocardioides convexus]